MVTAIDLRPLVSQRLWCFRAPRGWDPSISPSSRAGARRAGSSPSSTLSILRAGTPRARAPARATPDVD
jgi:hypothetical protein